ncbi:MAG: S-layer homology domain-containing protein [Lawsonibacter sp.]|uniref:S-layer homology domain-containing protein n=2 Tax=Flintibacter sp. TaxID=1918624 RepID=UPI002672A455|nr:S-layer homology domain-containing protein [Flintibacter sp.]MDY5038382.1 S-layer homology domain-containing protein [Lawsonibacter sp.]
MTLCLTVGAMTPLAHAAGGLRLVTSSQEAASQEVGFSGVSSNCQSFQATFNLSNSTAIYDFMANDVLDALPGIYTTYKQEGSAVTVYVTTKSGVLTSDGSLTLGTISANEGTNFTVEKASGVKVVGSDNSETTYTQVDQGGSSGGSSSGGSSSGGSSSGGSTTTTRTITIQSSFGGKVTASASQAAQGKVITLTALPNSGYVLKSLTVTTASGTSVPVANQSSGKYTFTMPAAAVTVKAVFAAQETDPGFPFADVAKGSWYYEGVRYAYENGLMSGTGEGTFSPDLPTSRGMLVTILYRLAGSPAAGSASFTDVAKGQWYADGVAWASANGVVSGYPDGSFRPNDTITREQMAAILYQYARIQGKLDDSRADLSIFSDLDSLSAYAKEPMSWAVAQGLFSGVSADTLAPGGSTTRAQAAVILTAFSKAQG